MQQESRTSFDVAWVYLGSVDELRVEEAAFVLGVDRKAVLNAIARGDIPAHFALNGKGIRVWLEDLDDFSGPNADARD